MFKVTVATLISGALFRIATNVVPRSEYQVLLSLLKSLCCFELYKTLQFLSSPLPEPFSQLLKDALTGFKEYTHPSVSFLVFFLCICSHCSTM